MAVTRLHRAASRHRGTQWVRQPAGVAQVTPRSLPAHTRVTRSYTISAAGPLMFARIPICGWWNRPGPENWKDTWNEIPQGQIAIDHCPACRRRGGQRRIVQCGGARERFVARGSCRLCTSQSVQPLQSVCGQKPVQSLCCCLQSLCCCCLQSLRAQIKGLQSMQSVRGQEPLQSVRGSGLQSVQPLRREEQLISR